MDKVKSLSSDTKVGIVLAVVLLITGLALVFANSGQADPEPEPKPEVHTLDVRSGEQLAIANARVAVSASALDGSGELKKDDCEILGSIAKSLDNDASWFSSCEFSLRGSMPDTDTNNVLKLSDGDYCATFTLNSDSTVLEGYTFTEGVCGDARFEIVSD